MKKTAYILSGSNISPVENTLSALEVLAQKVEICALSMAYETEAVGSGGPNFLNVAIAIVTEKTCDQLKNEVLAEIEVGLGRKRTYDKNAPRTMDLDVIIYDDLVLDGNLWKKAFIAIPMAEIVPDLVDPNSGRKLSEIASNLADNGGVIPKPEALRPFTNRLGK